jgi:transcriptional regulator with PAS, ATPase and Fis domain
MNTLLTFTGFQDPFSLGLVGQEEQPGPILSLIASRSFERVVLFSTPNTQENTLQTKEVLKETHSQVEVEVRDLALDDPTDYFSILRGLRDHLQSICANLTETTFYVAVASGTPQMHACWVLLTASGELPANLLYIRPPRFVSKDHPPVSEVNLSSSGFSQVQSGSAEKEKSIRSKQASSRADFSPGQSYVHEVSASYAPYNTLDPDAVAQKLGIIGDHPSFRKALEVGTTLAPLPAPILIIGETGTGKELFARFVHRLSGRPPDCFVPLNCAAIPEELVESILFGHMKGSFTGATENQTGKFDLADGGTLFLDEIGELPLSSQAKLLRVLEDGFIEVIGAKKTHKVDVRVVAATNQNLGKAIRQGKFREDLYYRLNVGEIRILPLRERKSDIPKIALHILARVNASLRKPKRFSTDALSRLQGHSWPGNVRDLENVIERSACLARTDLLDANDLLISDPVTYADPLAALPEPHKGFSLEEYLTGVRKQLMLRALEMAEGNLSGAARLLGVTPQAVHKFFRVS